MKNIHVFVQCLSLCCCYAHFSDQLKNGVIMSFLFFFFFENAKNLGRSDDGKRRKKRGWPKSDSEDVPEFFCCQNNSA